MPVKLRHLQGPGPVPQTEQSQTTALSDQTLVTAEAPNGIGIPLSDWEIEKFPAAIKGGGD
ncbi:MAG: hypothetical protein KGI49_03685 [Patescibacteria group bacterium]|nr:hypothetical protein [Patescibacteria group bacterium]